MQSANISFSRRGLKLMRDNFKKQFPIEALKGIKVLKLSNLTSKKHYEVTIPKNKYFPKGFWWTEIAHDAYDAKRKAIGHIIENNILK